MTCLARVLDPECVEIVEDLWPIHDGSGKPLPTVRIVKRGKPVDHRIDPEYLKSDVWLRLDALARRESVQRVFWPRNGFTRRIAAMVAQDWDKQINRPGYMFFAGAEKRDRADGVALEPDEALYLASGDCHTICARHRVTGMVIAVHAGRRNLLCPKCMKAGLPMRSIVDEIVDRMRISVDAHAWHTHQDLQFSPADVDVHIALGIAPRHFAHNHPDYREETKIMVDYLDRTYGDGVVVGNRADGRIDMPELIVRQFAKSGIPASNISHDGIDTATAAFPESDSRLFHSNNRGEKSRNLVFVVRKH